MPPLDLNMEQLLDGFYGYLTAYGFHSGDAPFVLTSISKLRGPRYEFIAKHPEGEVAHVVVIPQNEGDELRLIGWLGALEMSHRFATLSPQFINKLDAWKAAGNKTVEFTVDPQITRYLDAAAQA